MSHECHEQRAFRIIPNRHVFTQTIHQQRFEKLGENRFVRNAHIPLCGIPLLANPMLKPMTSHSLFVTLMTMGLIGGGCTSSLRAQTDSSATSPVDAQWWRGLFRSQGNASTPAATDASAKTLPPTSVGLDSDSIEGSGSSPEFPVLGTSPWRPVDSPGTLEWVMSRDIATLDSIDRSSPAMMQGYRIQIYFGTLAEARSVRASFRRDHADVACQLVPVTPNYAVTVGNYRDKWEAMRDLHAHQMMETYPQALVVPSEIDLPSLHP
jgi:hypothetical protein